MKQTATCLCRLSNRPQRLSAGYTSYPSRPGRAVLFLREPEEGFGLSSQGESIELTSSEWNELLDVAMCLSGVLRLGKDSGRFEESGAKELLVLAARRFEKILTSINDRLESAGQQHPDL